MQTVTFGESSVTLSFDERGHQKNHITYFAAANGANGELPAVIYPTVERFLGEGGTFLNPEAAHHTVEGVAPGTEIHGKEAVGGMEFAPVVLAPGQSVQYVVRFGMTGNETTLPQILAACDTAEKAETILVEVKKHWQEQVNVSFETGSREKDNYLRWICFQPILRRIYGCSFLPYHDYGKGGRGWRDLWQDCLALLIMNPSGVRQMIVDNYAGVRLDGTNATIIGEKQGEFVADRNNITRVWMDHAFWPLLTTEFYLNQTGDLKILLEKAPYFKDKQICRGTAHDDTWTPAEGCWQKDAERKLYKGTLLEHILLQNLCAFYDVGTHNELRLHNADWNDALDMAANKGESVAFTSAYAGNLRKIAAILGQMQERLDVQKVAVAEELTHLLGHSEYYGNAAQKQHILNDYQQLCAHANSGKTVDLPVNALQDDLNQKADWMMEHIRKTEWVTDGVGNGWLNGYYDDHGEQVEGLVYGTVRMMLPSQVFAIMSGTADEEQVRDICASADHYLYERTIGGYRLNTDFHEEKFDLGRMFGFAYGEKENGAVFSHMTVMYANALYQYQYTKDIVSVDGSQRGTTWQATPGLFAYRRSIAKDVLGTDDPAEVQSYLSDWDKFDDVAAQAHDKGYKMLSGYDDSFRVFSNNMSAPWVTGTTVTVDENIVKWIDQTKEYTDKGYNNKSNLWDSQWAADQGPTGKVFGFFYSTWGINFTLLGNSLATPIAEGGKEEVGNGIYGDYAVCEGPMPYYWGGTWICGAAGSDNIDLIRDIMQKLTCDEAIMKQITMDTQDYTNCEKAMEEIANSDYKSDFLGGQNHIALFAEAAKKIDMSNAGPYDLGMNESIQNTFKDYFTDNVDEDTAKANFETSIKEKYPELTDVVWPA